MSKAAVVPPDFTRAGKQIKQVLTLLSVARLEESKVRIDPQTFEEECESVGCFLNEFGCRFTCTVARFCVDAKQNGSGARLGRLQGSTKFEAVRWNHTVIVVSSQNHCGRIAATLFDVVQRRIAIQSTELIRILRGAVVGDHAQPMVNL